MFLAYICMNWHWQSACSIQDVNRCKTFIIFFAAFLLLGVGWGGSGLCHGPNTTSHGSWMEWLLRVTASAGGPRGKECFGADRELSRNGWGEHNTGTSDVQQSPPKNGEPNILPRSPDLLHGSHRCTVMLLQDVKDAFLISLTDALE